MLITIFVGGLLFFMLCGVPVAFAMGGTALISGIYLWGFEQIPINILAQRLLSGTNNFTTLAIPLFLLAGQLMNGSSITDRIFKFCQNLVGNVPGGLGQVNVLGSVIFSGMSGTAAADAAGIGSMEIKAMKDAGFDLPFSVAVTGASSLIGPIIPPSVPMVMYGVLAGVSVTGLFIGGILPGLIMALGMMVQVHIYSVKRNYPRGDKLNLKNLWESFKQAFFPLLTPVIIIGGIWSGVFTATEAAGVAVAYALVISLFVYRSISIKDTIALFKKSIVDCASILFVLGCVSMYGYVLTRTRLPEVLADGVISITTNPLAINIILIVILLIAGCFMSTMESIILFVPVFLPLMERAHINVMVFGLIMCLTLMIGQLTPPFGTVLFILGKVSGLGMDVVVRNSLPFTIPVFVTIVLILIFPQIVTILPSLVLK